MFVHVLDRLRGPLGWLGVAARAAIAGATVAMGPPAAAAAGVILLATVLAAVTLKIRVPARPSLFAIEVPVVLLWLSSLVFRIRSTTALAANPLDAAGLFRLGCIGLAGMLCLVALLQTDLHGRFAGLGRARPLWVYGVYVAVVCLGITTSVLPKLTAFHAVNIVIAVLAAITAYLLMGDEGLWRLEKTVFWCIVLHVATAWLGVIVFPSQALRAASPFPFRIQGVLPYMASDRLGEYGVVIFLWSFATRNGVRRDRIVPSVRFAYVLEVSGILTLLAAQYRTGYIALAVGILVILALRGRAIMALLIAAAGGLFVKLGPVLFQPVFAFFLRGQTANVASSLSGRTTLWSAAIPIWLQSPYIGGGIETASRYLVLGSIGRSNTGTVHGTWIETLVGTGVIGTALLAFCLIYALYRAFLLGTRSGRIAPVLILTVLAVRSITGSTFETFNFETLLFLAMVLAVREPQPFRLPRPVFDGLSADPFGGLPAPFGIPREKLLGGRS
jgi:O-antigen ligase